MPLRRSDWQEDLDWTVQAFRLASSDVHDETQIHTHICYCEFDDILDSIAALDADVVSIETSRSNMELLGSLAQFQYPNDIGPGVWDIHSLRVPSQQEMLNLLQVAAKVTPFQNEVPAPFVAFVLAPVARFPERPGWKAQAAGHHSTASSRPFPSSQKWRCAPSARRRLRASSRSFFVADDFCPRLRLRMRPKFRNEQGLGLEDDFNLLPRKWTSFMS